MARLIDLYDSGFDPNAVESARQYNPIPEGDYPMHVTKTDLKETKSKTGYTLEVEFTIIDGEFTDRTLRSFMNVRNVNQTAENIGLGELKRLSEACGVDFNAVVEDSDTLLYQPFLGHVVYAQEMVKNALGVKAPKVNPETGEAYGPRNKVTRFNSLSEQAPPPPQQVAPAAAPKQAATPPARPAAAAPAARAAAGAANPFGRRS